MRITAQLIDGATGDHVWAERYDRDLTDIFAIQDEISKAIVDALKVKLLPAEKKAIQDRGTTNADAYNFYLMARKYWITGNWGNTAQLELVIRICKRALELDPNYARAWGLMALVQCILHFTFAVGDDDGTAAADRALSSTPISPKPTAYALANCMRRVTSALPMKRLRERLRSIRTRGRSIGRRRAFSIFSDALPRLRNTMRKRSRSTIPTIIPGTCWARLYPALGDDAAAARAAKMAIAGAERALAHDPTNGAALSTVVDGPRYPATARTCGRMDGPGLADQPGQYLHAL